MHRATPANSSFRAYVAGGARATVNTVDDSKLMQEHASDFMSNESRSAIESPQNYGFTSVAAAATKDAMGKVVACAETFISFMGGNRSFPVAGAMDDRRHRLKGLLSGDVAMFRQATDFLQMHLSADGGFLTAARDKTVRLQLLDQDSGQQQQQSGAGAQTTDGSSGGTSGTSGGQQQQEMGQKAVYQDGQKTYRFLDVTKDETRASGTAVRTYLSDGKVYLDVNSDKTVYVGGSKDGGGQFQMLVTIKGPCTNAKGKMG